MSDFTKEQAVKALHDLREARESQGAELAKNKAAIDDLRTAVKALAEDRHRNDGIDYSPADAGVAKYITPEHTRTEGSSPVRFAGGEVKGVGYLPGLLDDTEAHGEWHVRLLDLVQRRNWVRWLSRQRGGAPASPRSDYLLECHMRQAPPSIRRLFSDSSTAGAEWIPDVHLPRLEQELRMARRTEALFGVMPMADKEIRIPFLTTGLRPYLKGAPTADDPGQYTSSSLATNQVSITATGFATRVQIDEDASEDSILATEAIMRAELVAALADGVNDAIINGDTGTHQDTGLTGWNIRSRWGSAGLGGSTDHRYAWVGLRARAGDVSNTTDQSGAKTYAGFLAALAKLDSPHGVEGDVVCIVSPEYYLGSMLGFTETKTLDVYGPQASILTGEVSKIGGKPIIIDEFVDAQYNASGVYDNSTKTKTGFLLVNRKRFFMGVRRGAAVEFDRDITRGLVNGVATVRKVFFTVDTSTKKNVHWSYNL